MAFCPKCGEKLEDGANFCSRCGTPIKENGNTSSKRRQEYAGKVIKCPSCGKELNSFTGVCPSCGHEINSVKVSDSAQSFISQVDDCDKDIADENNQSKRGWSCWNVKYRIGWVILNIVTCAIPLSLYFWILCINRTPKLTVAENRKSNLIENYAFPNDRESILEATLFIKSKMDFLKNGKLDAYTAFWLRKWVTKAEQLKQKAQIALKNDEKIHGALKEIFDGGEQTHKKYRSRAILCSIVSVLLILAVVITTGLLNGNLKNVTPEPTTTGAATKDNHEMVSPTEFPISTETPQPEIEKPTSYTIEKNSQYSYMSDERNVYIATAISDSIISIENWGKTLSSEKTVEYGYDVGTYKINDASNGFSWVDDEHTAFCITFQDAQNSRLKTPQSVSFTVNIDESDKFKGSDYNKKIICYSFQNDDLHLYRAVPLTEETVKIEAWCRNWSSDDFVYGYDVCVINHGDTDTDFEWTDDEHTSFTITMQDMENDRYWIKPTFVAFTVENEKYSYMDVKSYLGGRIVGADEVAVPASVSTYKHRDFHEVQQELASAGFTNISTAVLYDIVVGLTDEGEVKSVSIDDCPDFEQGDVFKTDAPVVITYHMKKSDDPAKTAEDNDENIIDEAKSGISDFFDGIGK